MSFYDPIVKAAVCREFGQPLTIEELVLDPPGPGEVRVDIKACAICASDLHAMDGSWGGSLPAVHGHEASGVVAELGDGVDGVAVGDRVIVSLLRTCHECRSCRSGVSHLCEAKGAFPIAIESRIHTEDGTDVDQGVYVGAFAEGVVVHASQVIGVPDDVPFEAAALLACGVITGAGAAINTARVTSGSSVVVIGAGGVGLNSIQGSALCGASTIVAADVADAKLADATEFGATHTVRVNVGDPIETVLSLTEGRGADFVLVTVGSTAAIEQALTFARPGGTVVVAGMTKVGDHARVETSGFASSEKRLIGSNMGSSDLQRDVPPLIAHYLAGRLKLDELVTGRYALDDINEAIASTAAGTARRNVIIFD